MTTALVRLEDTPQQWVYRFSRGGNGYCHICGKVLDGESRFACRAHYVRMGVLRFRWKVGAGRLEAVEFHRLLHEADAA